MNCRSCGSQLPPGAKVCPHCGTPVSPSSSQSEAPTYGSGAEPYPYGPPPGPPAPSEPTLPAFPSNTPRQAPPWYGSDGYTPPPANPSFRDQRQSYTPPPSAGPAMPPQAGTYPSYPPPAPQEQKQAHRFPIWIAVLLVVVVLLLIAGSGLIYYAAVYQPNLAHTHATATAVVHQTGTAQAHATATTQFNATATAAAQNPYTHTGALVFSDSLKDNSGGHRWDVNPNCAFKGGTYHAIAPNPKYSDYCIAEATNFINFTLEVQMQVVQGDGGGVTFRVINTSTVDQFYEFYLFRDGSYGLNVVNDTSKSLATGSNAPVKPNLNDINVIGIVAQDTTITVYVNHQRVASANDGTFSHGRIGVEASTSANGGQPTEVAYTNMKVWA